MRQYHDLPDWDDEHLKNISEDEGEEWQSGNTRAACKTLYQQWQQVVYLLNAAFAVIHDNPAEIPSDVGFPVRYWEEVIQNLMNDAMITAVKIRSSETGSIYILRMENAAIIRKCAGDIRTQLLLFEEAPGMDRAYIDILRREIDLFRELFIAWIATFKKDEFLDEWGLFV